MFATLVSPSAVLCVAAIVLTVLWCAMQARHLRATSAAGVSIGTWLILLWLSELWTVYGLIFHVSAEIFANLPVGALAALVVVRVARQQRTGRKTLARFLVLSAVVVGLTIWATAFHGKNAVPTVAVAGAIALYLPQVVKVFREGDLRGISLVGATLALLSSLAWGMYGIVIQRLPVALPSVVIVPCSAWILGRVVLSQRRPALEQPS